MQDSNMTIETSENKKKHNVRQVKVVYTADSAVAVSIVSLHIF